MLNVIVNETNILFIYFRGTIQATYTTHTIVYLTIEY